MASLSLEERLFLCSELTNIAGERLETPILRQGTLLSVASWLGARDDAARAEGVARPMREPRTGADEVALDEALIGLQEHRRILAEKLATDPEMYYAEYSRGEDEPHLGMPPGPLVLQDIDLAIELLERYRAAPGHRRTARS